jgi:hypothetical protein
LVDLGHGVAAGRHGWISDLSLSLFGMRAADA